jgi:ribosomal peptide maturation radical SAM protein 1
MTSVALVYPPFGPAGLPSLGLSILSQQLKAAGHDCRTHYWNLDVLDALPGNSALHRAAAYRALTERGWFPYNEWCFAGELFGDRLADRDSETTLALINRSLGAAGDDNVTADVVLHLRNQSGRLIDEIVECVRGTQIVGISTTFYQNLPALALAKAVKSRSPQTLVVLGGANCDDVMGSTLFENFEFLDAVFTGEADVSFVEYADAVGLGAPPSDLPGALLRTSSRAARSGGFVNLNRLGVPDFTDWVAQRERHRLHELSPLVIALEASRGCWWGQKHHCTFCGLNGTGMAYRSKDVSHLAEELSSAIRRTGARFAYMTDNILAMDHVSALTREPLLAHEGTELFFEVKSNLDLAQLQALSRNGVTAVQPGIESLSSDLLQLMDKGVSASQNVAFIRNAQTCGIRPTYNLLHNFPGEDEQWYLEMIEQIPSLVHLWPPAALAEVEFHRFSPYQTGPQRWGLTLEPLPGYQALYPFDSDTIAGIAYMFTCRDRPAGSYGESLQRSVFAWRQIFARGAALTQVDESDEIVLWDTRPAFGPKFVHLRGHAACVYRALAVPRTTEALRRMGSCRHAPLPTAEPHVEATRSTRDEAVLVVDVDRDGFREHATEWLALMHTLGLLFRDRCSQRSTRWVALGVPNDAPMRRDQWADAGI